MCFNVNSCSLLEGWELIGALSLKEDGEDMNGTWFAPPMRQLSAHDAAVVGKAEEAARRENKSFAVPRPADGRFPLEICRSSILVSVIDSGISFVTLEGRMVEV